MDNGLSDKTIQELNEAFGLDKNKENTNNNESSDTSAPIEIKGIRKPKRNPRNKFPEEFKKLIRKEKSGNNDINEK